VGEDEKGGGATVHTLKSDLCISVRVFAGGPCTDSAAAAAVGKGVMKSDGKPRFHKDGKVRGI
jgi:hypothetical protein